MSITHEQTKQNKKERGALSDAKLYGAALLAAVGIAYVGVKKIENVNEVNQAKVEFEAPNQPHNVVSLDADTTVFAVASAAVNEGYLKMDPREASDFLVAELSTQLQAKGILEDGAKVDLGKIQPGTSLEVPASWSAIGVPSDEQKVDIGTAIHTEVDSQGREVTIEGYQDGHTTTTVNPG